MNSFSDFALLRIELESLTTQSTLLAKQQTSLRESLSTILDCVFRHKSRELALMHQIAQLQCDLHDLEIVQNSALADRTPSILPEVPSHTCDLWWHVALQEVICAVRSCECPSTAPACLHVMAIKAQSILRFRLVADIGRAEPVGQSQQTKSTNPCCSNWGIWSWLWQFSAKLLPEHHLSQNTSSWWCFGSRAPCSRESCSWE